MSTAVPIIAIIVVWLFVLAPWLTVDPDAVLPGVVLAYILQLPLILGAFVAGLGSALLAGWLQDNSRVKRDTVLGVVMSGMFGLGVVLYTAIPSDLHLDHILFGNMLGIGPEDLRLAAM